MKKICGGCGRRLDLREHHVNGCYFYQEEQYRRYLGACADRILRDTDIISIAFFSEGHTDYEDVPSPERAAAREDVRAALITYLERWVQEHLSSDQLKARKKMLANACEVGPLPPPVLRLAR